MRTVLDFDHLVTAEEFATIPKGDASGDYRWELLAGRVIRMSPPGARHGVIAARLTALLYNWSQHTHAGVVMGESGCLLTRNPDTVVGPYLSFMRQARMPQAGIPVGWWAFAPDLVVEILSPDNRFPELRHKLTRYLDGGAQIAWVIDPDRKTVTVYRLHAQPNVLGSADTLDGGDVLPGFSCGVASIFEGL